MDQVASKIVARKITANLISDIDAEEYNTSQKSGNYQAFSTGTHTYRLENNSGKHVAITFNKLNY